jgi:hypothetical protein
MAEGRPEKVTSQPTQKEWRRPGLRKLPIAATAHGGKATISGDDGVGGGKGDVSTLHS